MALIRTTADLKKALDTLAQAPFITVDTEFHRQSTYYPELCLIQAASPKGEILLDPLSPQLDLAPFFALMRQPDILKVFHAARQDIEIFYLLSGSIPAPLFDTQIAAMACGYGESVSYDTLVHKITGIELDKSSRFTDWRVRPLTQKQLDYALADVTHLRDVYTALAADLQKSGRQAWLTEEMAVLNAPETYKLPPEQAWKKIRSVKGRLKKPQQWAALQNLAAWREDTAQRNNLPRGYILSDESLIDIAAQLPQNKSGLLSLRSLAKPPRHKLDSEAVLRAVAESKNTAESEPPQFVAYHSGAEKHKSETEILKLLLKILADRHNVAAKIIATGEDIGKIAAEGKKADCAAMRGWRFDIFGAQAVAMLEGRLAIKFEKGMPQLFTPQNSAP